MSDTKSYSDYLKSRSFKAEIYRRYWLYPQLDRMLIGTVLDFGCGIGDFLAYRPNSIGVDINPYNIDLCLARGLDACLLKTKYLPFEDGCFGSVIMDNVLEHISPAATDDILCEIIRVVAKRGRIVIGVPGRKGYSSDDDHKCFYSAHDLVCLMGKYGCEHVKTLHMPLKLPRAGEYLRQYCIYGVFNTPG